MGSDRAQAGLARASSGAEWVSGEPPSSPGPRMNLHVGVLHYTPFREPFPLLAEPVTYTPDTLDIWVLPCRICGFRGLRVFIGFRLNPLSLADIVLLQACNFGCTATVF